MLNRYSSFSNVVHVLEVHLPIQVSTMSANLTVLCVFVCLYIAAGNMGPSPWLERHTNRQEIGKQHERCGPTSRHCSGEYSCPLCENCPAVHPEQSKISHRRD